MNKLERLEPTSICDLLVSLLYLNSPEKSVCAMPTAARGAWVRQCAEILTASVVEERTNNDDVVKLKDIAAHDVGAVHFY